MTAGRAGSVSGVKGDDWTMAHATATAHLPRGLRSACSGTFRVESNDGKRPAVLRCDECDATTSVRQSTLQGAPPARPTELLPF